MINRYLIRDDRIKPILLIGMIILLGSTGLNYFPNYLLQEDNQNTVINNKEIVVKGTAQLSGFSKITYLNNFNPDVGITDVIDLDAMNLLEHYPGRTVHLKVTIMNFGEVSVDTPFDVLMTVSNGSESYPNYFFQDILTLPDHLKIAALEPNSSYDIYWNWSSPIAMPDGAKYNFSDGPIIFRFCFTTLLSNDQVSSNNQICRYIKIKKPDFNVRLETNQPTYYYSHKPGEINQFELNFTLYNLGEATFINYTVIAPKDWKVIPPPRQFWKAETNSKQVQQNLSLNVFPSPDLQYLPTNTPLFIELTAMAESYILASYTLVFKIWVSFIPKPIIIPPNTPVGYEVYYVEPGVNYIDFIIKNMGNGEDNFFISIQLATGQNISGLEVELQSSSVTKTLKTYESQIVTIKLTVPKNIDVNIPIALKLFAESIKDPMHIYAKCNSTYYVFSSKYQDVSFEVDRIEIDMYPESKNSIIISIRNTGNSLDNTIQVNVTNHPLSWRINLDTSNIPSSGIPRNGTANVEVRIVSPQCIMSSHYSIELSATSENKIKDKLNIDINILETSNFSISCKKARKSGNPGEKVPFIISIENFGNVEDYYEFEYINVTPNPDNLDWEIDFSMQSLPLFSYSSRDVIVYIKIPYHACADINFRTLRADGYVIQILGCSQNDSKMRSALELEVVVNPVYDFSFNKQKDEKFLILEYKRSVYYTFSITNEGNDWDYYKISYESEYHWLNIPFVERKLLPGVTEKLNIEIIPQEEQIKENGEYIFYIRGTSKREPGLIRDLELIIKTIKFDLAVTELRVGSELFSDAEILVGETVLLRANIVNIGDLDYYNKTAEHLLGSPDEISLLVRFTEETNFIGEVEISYLSSKRDGENNSIWVGVVWKTGKPGKYDIMVEVNPEFKIPESKLTNNRFSGSIIIAPINDQVENNNNKLMSGYYLFILFLIIIFLIFMLTGIYLTMKLTIVSKKRKKLGYTANGEYKPGEEVLKMRFLTSSDDEYEKDEEEFDLVVLSTPEQLEQLVEKVKNKEEFISGIILIRRTKPIKKTRPIRKSKPMVHMIPIKKIIKTHNKSPNIARQVIQGHIPEKPK